MKEAKFIVHLVMLDEDLRTAFVTRHPEKADDARRVLAASFGNDRVSVTRYGESSLKEYRDLVAQWKSDPRIPK